MLTENQLSELQPFIQHPRFGKLLFDAIEIWKTMTPGKGAFGLCSKELENGLDIFIGYNCCCLVGASLIGKKCEWYSNRKATQTHCAENFNLKEKEVLSLIQGFDNTSQFSKIPYTENEILDKEAYNFGYTISEIIFNNGQNI